jgi:hypothetical protein
MAGGKIIYNVINKADFKNNPALLRTDISGFIKFLPSSLERAERGNVILRYKVTRALQLGSYGRRPCGIYSGKPWMNRWIPFQQTSIKLIHFI